MKLNGFTNFIEQHLVPYKSTSISLVVIKASICGYYRRGFNSMTRIDKLHYVFRRGVYKLGCYV